MLTADIENIIKLTNGAHRWMNEGNVLKAQACISTALMNFLSISAINHDKSNLAKRWLSDSLFVKLFQDYSKNLFWLGDEVTAGRQPNSVIGGNYSYLTFVHVAWVLREFDLGEKLVRFAIREDVTELSTPFWNEYAHAMLALVEKKPYSVPSLTELVDLEKYWSLYLELISATTLGKDLEDVTGKVEEAFLARNQDKSLKDDHYATEGTGSHPVKWDYRRDGLISYIHANY